MKQQSDIAFYEIFCHNIVWLHKHHRLSKRKMTALLGIGVWTLNKLEQGEIPPKLTIDIFLTIQRNFGIYPSEQFSKRLGDES